MITRLAILLAAISLTACGEPTGSLDHGEAFQEPQAGMTEFSSPSPHNTMKNSELPASQSAQTESFQPENTLPNDLGFYDLKSDEIPSAVKSAADSVFSIRMLIPQDESSFTFVDVTQNDFDKQLTELYDFVDPKHTDPLARQVMKLQLERCQKLDAKTQKKCPVVVAIVQGSGFLVEDGQSLWTNSHIVEHILKAGEKFGSKSIAEQIASHQKVPLFVFNHESLLLLEPYSDTALIDVTPTVTKAAKNANRFYAQDSDYMRLKLSRPIGRPLKLAKHAPAAGEQMFALGYPVCTGCDPELHPNTEKISFTTRAPAPDADGTSLRISMGKIINAKEAFEFFGMPASASEFFDMKRLKVYTADSQFGSSGGPLLNAQAEVFGIHAGGQSKLSNKRMLRRSRGVIPPQFIANDKLEALTEIAISN